jgi:hypothetical protein
MEAQGMFQNILWQNIMEPSMTRLSKNDSFFFLLTFETSLSEEELMSTIYVFTLIGAAGSCTNVQLHVGQNPYLSTSLT